MDFPKSSPKTVHIADESEEFWDSVMGVEEEGGGGGLTAELGL